MTCGRRFPVTVWGRVLYVTCTLPHGHDAECAGTVTEYGRPRI